MTKCGSEVKGLSEEGVIEVGGQLGGRLLKLCNLPASVRKSKF